MEIINRIKRIAEERGISASFLCKKMGVGRSYFVDVVKRNGIIPDNKLEIIANTLFTSVEYLKTGKESNNAELPEQDKKVLDMLHSLDAEGKEKAEQYLELLSLQYGKTTIEDEIDEIISALPDKTDDTVIMRIAAFGGGVHEVKVSKDDLRDVVNMLEEEEEN